MVRRCETGPAAWDEGRCRLRSQCGGTSVVMFSQSNEAATASATFAFRLANGSAVDGASLDVNAWLVP